MCVYVYQYVCVYIRGMDVYECACVLNYLLRDMCNRWMHIVMDVCVCIELSPEGWRYMVKY